MQNCLPDSTKLLLFPVEKSIFLSFFSSFGDKIPKYVFPSFILRKDLSIKPKAFIFITKPSFKYKLSFMVNSSLGTVSTIFLSFEIISSGTFSFKLSSKSKFISSVFNVF